MKKVIIALICAFTALICVFLLCGCKAIRQTVEVPVYVHDTTYVAKIQHDSTYIDRWHTEYQKGDTTLIHDSLTFYHYIFRTDTAYKYVERPVEVTITKTKEVAMPLRWWQKTLIYSGIFAWSALVVWLLFRHFLPTKMPTKKSN